MPDLERMPQSQVLRLVAQADPREFCVFLGAGASKSSGVPLAGEMIAEWRRMIFEDRAPAGADFDAWCAAQAWFGQDEEYSVLFETLFPNERARQKYVEPRIEAGFPNWCYLYLANLIVAGRFNVVLTTNFDDLINDALSMYLGYNPVVCAADSQVESINIATQRAKIIKLHGDYLFRRLKNTVEELEQLDPGMEAKVGECAKQCGLLVLGYAGRDRSIMRVIGAQLRDPNAFPAGIYWSLRPGEAPHAQVAALVREHPRRVHLFESPDFDSFMAGLHARLGLDLPRTVLQPYEALRDRFARLVRRAPDAAALDAPVRDHVRELEKQLNRPWATATDTTRFDLLEAQLALGRRDYRAAIELAASFSAACPDDAAGLTTWGDALALKAEEESSEAAGEEAVQKWRAAIALDDRALPALYSLARFCVRRQRTAEAIEACERIARLAPADTGMRRNLVQLYITKSRSADALRELDTLAGREPLAADLFAMRAIVYEQRGLIEEALAAARRSVELDGRNAWTRMALGNQLARTGRPDEAEAHYEQAVVLDPDNLAYRLQVGQFHAMRQKPARALVHFEHAAAIEPGSAEVHGWLAELYAAQGRLDEARRAIGIALARSPRDSRVVGNAGIIHLRLREDVEAERHLQDAHGLNPSAPQPLWWLAILYWVQGRDPEAMATLQRLGALVPPLAQQLAAMFQQVDVATFGNRARRREMLEAQWAAAGAAPPAAPQAIAAAGGEVRQLLEQFGRRSIEKLLGR